jgi:hypothetical protein
MTDLDAPMPPRQRQALLQARFPNWEIWYVPKALGGFTWCARRHGEANLLNTLTADRASRLAELIEQAQAGDAFHAPDVFRMDRPER